MIKIEGILVKTDTPETHRIHRVKFDTDTYFSAGLLLNGETEEDFEEVSLEDVPVQEEDYEEFEEPVLDEAE